MTTLGDAAAQAARSTGLPQATCVILLEEGWTLVNEMGQPTRWEAPQPLHIPAPDEELQDMYGLAR